MSTGESYKLATVKLKVIDILGRVGETEVDAMYYPGTQYQEQHQVGQTEASVQYLSHTQDATAIMRHGRFAAAGAIIVLVVIVGVIFTTRLLPGWLFSGPTLQVAGNIAPPAVDLSAEGTLDWVHWGYLESDNAKIDEFIGHPIHLDCMETSHCINRKQGNPQIGDFAAVGQYDGSILPFRLYVRDAFTRFSWNDGSPISSANNARTNDYMAGVGNGYRIQVPAGQATHTFRLYLGVWNAQVKCTASLSDSSVPDYVNTSLKPSSYNYVYTFTYRSASPDQILTVDLTILKDYGGASTGVSAATLQ
jgi:hypothetical protein